MSQQAAALARQNITRSSHTLPVCYQESFTKPDGEIFVQFLDKDKPARVFIRLA
jgi:hypothetical protein